MGGSPPHCNWVLCYEHLPQVTTAGSPGCERYGQNPAGADARCADGCAEVEIGLVVLMFTEIPEAALEEATRQ